VILRGCGFDVRVEAHGDRRDLFNRAHAVDAQQLRSLPALNEYTPGAMQTRFPPPSCPHRRRRSGALPTRREHPLQFAAAHDVETRCRDWRACVRTDWFEFRLIAKQTRCSTGDIARSSSWK